MRRRGPGDPVAPRPKRHLLVDADVLIDYLKTDESILQLASRHVGVLHVTSVTVAEEVKGLDPAGCARLGLQIVEPDLDQVMEATAARGQLSFKDHLCLLIAKDEGWECATNDRALRKACVTAGIRAVWGLELMVELVTSHGLSPKRAVAVAERIHKTNPTHITREIVARFVARVIGRG